MKEINASFTYCRVSTVVSLEHTNRPNLQSVGVADSLAKNPWRVLIT